MLREILLMRRKMRKKKEIKVKLIAFKSARKTSTKHKNSMLEIKTLYIKGLKSSLIEATKIETQNLLRS